ncbi:MAG: cytochrome c oxidase assembly protein [Candidatus Sericytochromatia bacterium]
MLGRLATTIFLAMAAGPAMAHGGHAHHEPAAVAWWTQWDLDPLILGSLGLLAYLYQRGVRRLWAEAGPGRGIARRHAGAFALGLAALLVALVSPIAPMAERLNAVHMVQHMTIMMVAAPLVVAGSPGLAVLQALPARLRRATGRGFRRSAAARSGWYLLWQPALMFVLYALTLWVWHLPTLYQAALAHPLLHDLQHVMFFVAACLFWRVVLDPLSRLRLGAVPGVLYLFLTSIHAMFLGVFMALSPRAWYPFYEGTAPAFRLSALQDQQIAGAIMWMPACALYAVVAAWLFAVWLREPAEEPA